VLDASYLIIIAEKLKETFNVSPPKFKQLRGRILERTPMDSSMSIPEFTPSVKNSF
jgi:hypothetical protein